MTQAEITVDTRDGKKLTLKRPNVLVQYRLVAALGDLAENRVYLSMTLPLIYVAAIDGEQVLQPSSRREVEGLIQRLGEDGMAAVVEAIAEHFTPKDEQEVIDTAKKSPKTKASVSA
ncbi:hypothetical protein [Thiomonas sp.]|jgi:hypothetical protein|uniref:hypothetical protein n=1 Tax=Thiomonas sp. TaxID=2047785 RepID=UPI0017548F41|nr:hypothetical protein [Thiomonas sp.]